MVIFHDSYVADNFQQVQVALNEHDLDALADGTDQYSHAMSPAFYKAAKEAEEGRDEARFRALHLMGRACSFMLSPDKPNEPFEPVAVMGGRRSAIPNDFTEAEIWALAGAVEHVNNPVLKARLADVVWTCQKSLGVAYALTAIDNYTKVPLKTDDWFLDWDKGWQRAIVLARMIGEAAGDRIDRTESEMVQALQLATSEDRFFARSLADTLKSNGLGKTYSAVVAAKLSSLAHEFNAVGDFHLSSSFYNAASDWSKWSGDVDKSIDMTLAEAEASVGDADAWVSSEGSNYAVAATFLERAVQVYRSIPRAHRSRHQVDERIQGIRLRINDYGPRSLEELSTMTDPEVDLSEHAQQARGQVGEKPMYDALKAFVNLHQTSADRLRKAAIESLSVSPLRAIIPKVFSSHDGRVVGRTYGISLSEPSEDDEEEINAEMIGLHYKWLVECVVVGSIMPALETLTLEHRLRTADFVELARRSPIVPAGREGLFGKALSFGFDRDFAACVHLLAPQIEHMVRTHLKAAGVNTTNLDQNGVETENGLSSLINQPEVSKIFGDELAFEIRALFCDEFGPNLRNNVAHGLLDDQQAFSYDAIYAWWLALKMVFNTFWNSLSADAGNEDQQSSF